MHDQLANGPSKTSHQPSCEHCQDDGVKLERLYQPPAYLSTTVRAAGEKQHDDMQWVYREKQWNRPSRKWNNVRRTESNQMVVESPPSYSFHNGPAPDPMILNPAGNMAAPSNLRELKQWRRKAALEREDGLESKAAAVAAVETLEWGSPGSMTPDTFKAVSSSQAAVFPGRASSSSTFLVHPTPPVCTNANQQQQQNVFGRDVGHSRADELCSLFLQPPQQQLRSPIPVAIPTVPPSFQQPQQLPASFGSSDEVFYEINRQGAQRGKQVADSTKPNATLLAGIKMAAPLRPGATMPVKIKMAEPTMPVGEVPPLKPGATLPHKNKSAPALMPSGRVRAGEKMAATTKPNLMIPTRSSILKDAVIVMDSQDSYRKSATVGTKSGRQKNVVSGTSRPVPPSQMSKPTIGKSPNKANAPPPPPPLPLPPPGTIWKK